MDIDIAILWAFDDFAGADVALLLSKVEGDEQQPCFLVPPGEVWLAVCDKPFASFPKVIYRMSADAVMRRQAEHTRAEAAKQIIRAVGHAVEGGLRGYPTFAVPILLPIIECHRCGALNLRGRTCPCDYTGRP